MKTFSALLACSAENSPVPGEFSAPRPVTRSFDVFFDLNLNKWLSKQSRGWWFEMPSGSLWRQCNGCLNPRIVFIKVTWRYLLRRWCLCHRYRQNMLAGAAHRFTFLTIHYHITYEYKQQQCCLLSAWWRQHFPRYWPSAGNSPKTTWDYSF